MSHSQGPQSDFWLGRHRRLVSPLVIIIDIIIIIAVIIIIIIIIVIVVIIIDIIIVYDIIVIFQEHSDCLLPLSLGWRAGAL